MTLDKDDQIRCSPDPARIGAGNHTLVWTCRTPGVDLVSIEIDQGPGKPVWPGSRPAKKPDGSISADDSVEPGSGKVTFKYSVSVTRGEETFDLDPVLENDGGG